MVLATAKPAAADARGVMLTEQDRICRLRRWDEADGLCQSRCGRAGAGFPGNVSALT